MTAPLFALTLAVLTLAAPSQLLGPVRKEPVQRVVTLAPSLTETVLALDAGALLVGVSRFDERAEVKALPRVGGYTDPSVEAVLTLKPDLVLVQPAPGNRQPVEKMVSLGLSILSLPMRSMEEAVQGIRAVGLALGRTPQSEALISRIEKTRTEVRARAKTRAPTRVLIIYGFEPLVVAGPGSFVAELLQDVGAQNAAAEAKTPYVMYSAESALRSRPDIVVNAAHSDRGVAQYAKLPGLKQARWVKAPSSNLMQPGPGLGAALIELETLLYGPTAQVVNGAHSAE